jgi:hypothetical protein
MGDLVAFERFDRNWRERPSVLTASTVVIRLPLQALISIQLSTQYGFHCFSDSDVAV